MDSLPHMLAPVRPESFAAAILDLFLAEDAPTAEDYAEVAGWNEDYHSDADAPAEPALPLHEWVAVQAAFYRSLGSAAGDFLARHIDDLAASVRRVTTLGRGITPAEARDRLDAEADDDVPALEEYRHRQPIGGRGEEAMR